MRRRKSLAARCPLRVDRLGNQVGEEAERIEHRVPVVSLGRVLEDAEKLVGRQTKETPRFVVQCLPDLFARPGRVSTVVAIRYASLLLDTAYLG